MPYPWVLGERVARFCQVYFLDMLLAFIWVSPYIQGFFCCLPIRANAPPVKAPSDGRIAHVQVSVPFVPGPEHFTQGGATCLAELDHQVNITPIFVLSIVYRLLLLRLLIYPHLDDWGQDDKEQGQQ